MATQDPNAAVSGRLARVRERMAAACATAGRDPDAVRLVAVSKRIDLTDVVEACAAGQWDLGENRVQDALARQAELAAMLSARGLDPARVRWHFIGHLQRNKASKAAGRFHLLHGVDSQELAEALSRRAVADGRRESVLVEVNISSEEQKNGVAPEAAPEFLERVAGLPGLEVGGLMGMARHGADAAELSRSFASLRRLAEEGRRLTGLALPELSMGMSADFEVAIAEGATLVRVGSAIFGPRRY